MLEEQRQSLGRRFSFVAFLVSSGGALLFTAAWFVLNHFRSGYYNSAMEGALAQESPYWIIIRVQKFLEWPIKLAFCIAVLSLLFAFAEFIAVIVRKIGQKRGPA
jgi:hypothetical protein